MIRIDARTSLYCLFGRPAVHSLSPAMHNAAFEYMGLNSLYMAFEPENLRAALSAMKALPIHGASLTIPFKTEIMDYIDAVDPLALKIGSVNTLRNSGGVISGYNTDGFGALLALTNSGIFIKNSRILILGNGGSARAIAFTLLQENARVIIAGRNSDRIESLSSDLGKYSPGIDHILIDRIDAKFTGSLDIIINTTPVGMTPFDDQSPLPDDVLNPTHTVMDIVYSPRITRLLAAASARGCKTIGGLHMLLYQGAKQFEIWTGLEAPVEIMEKALQQN